MKNVTRRLAFSLVEVVVAVGIFAVAIVGVIGLFAPTTKNVAAVADADASTRVVAAIQSTLRATASTTTGFNDLIAAVDKTTIYYYASRGGDKVDTIPSPGSVVTSNADRFFEFSLARNTALSPNAASDATAGFLAFTINLRWPAYLPNGVQVPDIQKSTQIIPTAVTR